MVDTYNQPTWRRCDECDADYFLGATLNPRNHRFSPIPLSMTPNDKGNFRIDWTQEFVNLFDARDIELGQHPVVVYGQGPYRPHNPSHFLEHSHGEEEPRQRGNNFTLPMDEDEDSPRNLRRD
jgi:hypothetical protein